MKEVGVGGWSVYKVALEERVAMNRAILIERGGLSLYVEGKSGSSADARRSATFCVDRCGRLQDTIELRA